MDTLTIILLVLFLLAVQGVVLYIVLRRREAAPEEGSGMVLLQQQMQELARTLDARVSESSKAMQENAHRQFTESSRLIKEITQEVTSVKEIGRQTQSFAEQLQNLQDILKNPKQRGILGEYYLETVLKNVLPPGSYEMQYKLGLDDEGKELIPDAVVFVKEKIIPIDSKFSLENYNRLVEERDPLEKERLEKAFVNDLKNRIVETSKYIRPEKGTMDFAFMFIPHEAIYYDLLTNRVGLSKSNEEEEANLIQRAAGKYKVLIISPTSLLAYLQTVLQGLRGMEIEERAVDIQKRVGELVKHIETVNSLYLKLGGAIGTVVSHFNSGHKELAKIDKDVYRITGEKAGVEVELLDKPLAADE